MPENPTNSVQAFIANPLFGLVLALLLTFLSLVASYKMTAILSNGLLVLSWGICFGYAFFTGWLPHFELLPRILWTVFFAAGLGLCFYYSPLWTRPTPKPLFGAHFWSVEHLPNDEIAGIKWQSAYSELDINIINRSDRDCVDLDICLKPDLLVAKIGCREHSGNAEVSFEPAIALRVNDPRVGDARGMQLLATDVGYQMRCSRLPPKGHLIIVLALVTADLNKNRNPRGFEDFAMGMNVKTPSGEGGYMVWGYPSADIYLARPTNAPCIAVDGVFTANQGTERISKRICAEPPE